MSADLFNFVLSFDSPELALFLCFVFQARRCDQFQSVRFFLSKFLAFLSCCSAASEQQQQLPRILTFIRSHVIALQVLQAEAK